MRYIQFCWSVLVACFVLTGCGHGSTSNSPIAVHNDTAIDKAVGGPCDRCEMMFEGMPPADKITAATTLAPAGEPGDKLLLHGRLLMKDGKAPAKNIILYIYHTDVKGYYSPAATQTAARANGHLRGWIKSDDSGRFTIQSIRPAPYPGRDVPAHIHILVKEPGKTRYYIDEVWFDDDPLVTNELRGRAEKRGGDLIIHLNKMKDGSWEGTLPITLGLNIPDYN